MTTLTLDSTTDTTLALECLVALRGRVSIPRDVVVTVSGGCATLEGIVDWAYQKEVAENAVRYIRGIKGVFNRIAVHNPELTAHAG